MKGMVLTQLQDYNALLVSPLSIAEKEGRSTQSCKLIVNGRTLSKDAASLSECQISSTTKM